MKILVFSILAISTVCAAYLTLATVLSMLGV